MTDAMKIERLQELLGRALAALEEHNKESLDLFYIRMDWNGLEGFAA